jgi:hypothetical protein
MNKQDFGLLPSKFCLRPETPAKNYLAILSPRFILYIQTVFEGILMAIQSGVKAIDNLVTKHGLAYKQVNNPFQYAQMLPPSASVVELREAISAFGLANFPPAIWLYLLNHCQQRGTILHQFSIPQLDGKTFCWILLSADGALLEWVSSMHKTNYLQACKYLANALVHHIEAPQHFALHYG